MRICRRRRRRSLHRLVDAAHAKSFSGVFITFNTSIAVHVCVFVCLCVAVVDSIARNLGHQPILTAARRFRDLLCVRFSSFGISHLAESSICFPFD